MPYVGQKPADIIATAVDTTTGKFSGEVDAASLDISGNIDVDGTTNLDVVDIDGAVDMASTLTLAGNADFNGDLDVDGTTNLDVVDIDGAVNMATTALVTGVATFTATPIFNSNITVTDGSISSGVTHTFNLNGATGTGGSPAYATYSFVGDPNTGMFSGTADTLKFATAGAEQVRIHSNGVLSASDGVALGVGTANTASNVLDDYEEGTWTPSIGGNASYTHQSGTYVKIGRFVFLSCDIKINVIGTGVATQLNGAPFTAISNGYPQGGISIMYYEAIATAVTSFNGYINNNNTVLTFSGNTGTAATTIGLNGFNVFKNGARVSFSISYQAAD